MITSHDPAYSFGGETLSWDELSLCADRIAAFLKGKGCSRAAVFGGKSPLVFAAIHACLRAGICRISVDRSIPAKRREPMFAAADIVLYDEEPPECPPEKLFGLSDIISEEDSAFIPEKNIPPETPAYMIFTSGTTGTPKGIRVSRGNLESFARFLREIPPIKEEKPRRVLNQANFSFDLSVAEICCSYFEGMSVIALETGGFPDFGRLFSDMRDSRADIAVFTPSFAEMCLCDDSFCAELLPELKVIFFCGEVLKPGTAAKLFSRFPGIRIINAYGPSETTCAVCASEITEDMTNELPIGDISSAAGGIAVLCDGGNETNGETGEIVIYGDSVAEYTGNNKGFGIYNGQRCFFTGDLGVISEGKLYFRGRRDRQIKLMGHRIELSDIESCLSGISGVLQAAAKQENGSVFAYVRTDGSISAEEIKSALKETLPAYMIPRRIVITSAIPLTPNGKTDRSAL